MNRTFEECLIDRCAPTLAGVKPGNLFSFSGEEKVPELLRIWNRQLSDKGIRLTALRQKENRHLILVYRPKALRAILENQDIVRFLDSLGYTGCGEPEEFLRALASRIESGSGFPHEIGVLLGYPLHDVRGFIQNRGGNACCSGCWKVYDRREEAECQFRRYDLCTGIYLKMYRLGKSVMQLTVVA